MPADAKKFAKIDKDWQKIMQNATQVMSTPAQHFG